MIAMMFEVWPKKEHKQDYLDVAAELLPLLNDINGFISIERFESLAEPGKILSLGFFENEEAVMAWRKTDQHRQAQSLGRNEFFSNYRLRIATVSRDYGMSDRAEAPIDSNHIHQAT